ncbi:MAG: hypothetical protein JNJ92_04900 [Altererythrobacter sp.]|nr:hypothetical protein [Altererythrobacter sp.]
MNLPRLLRLCPLFLLAAPLPSAGAIAADDTVMVLGALHGLHEREPAFPYDRLRAAIIAFAPDVLILEVRPDELAGRTQTPGRPEYPAMVWPLLATLKADVVAMEPGGAVFEQISGQAGAAFDELKRRDPGGAAALKRLDEAAEDVLMSYWERPGQVQDDQTASLAAGLQAAQFALAGPAFAAAQARWDGHMAAQILRTVRANPVKRVMVIASYKNRAVLERAVHDVVPRRMIDAASWFETLDAAATRAR